MLKITKASEAIEVKNVVVSLYSVPGIGKTSTAFTAEKPLLLDFDKGAYRSANRGDTVGVESWTDVTSITADDLAPYSTVVVDTAGRGLDCLTAFIIKNNPKAATRAGALSLQGYGELKAIFVAWTKLIRSFGKDVVLLSHSDEQKDGDEVKERLDIQGGSKNEIYKVSDCMGRIYMRNGKRIVNFSPTDTAFGKNPAGMAPIDVPDFATTPDFLAGVIAQVKTALNRMSVDQVATAGALTEWKETIAEAGTPEQFNALLPSYKAADEGIKANVWRLINKAAKAKGFKFEKASGFTAVQAAA